MSNTARKHETYNSITARRRKIIDSMGRQLPDYIENALRHELSQIEGKLHSIAEILGVVSNPEQYRTAIYINQVFIFKS